MLPPEVSTGDPFTTATATTASAKFSATITTNGMLSILFWRYRKADLTFQSVVGPVQVPGNVSGAVITITVDGLELETEYEVAAFAQHIEGPLTGQRPTQGEWIAFTTPEAGTTDPPFVSTDLVTAVSATGALLLGSCSPNGEATEAWFEVIGPTGEFETDHQDMGSGTSFVELSETLSGLVEETQYSVRAVAQNSAGQQVFGQFIQFTTLNESDPPAITLLEVTPVGPTAARAEVTLTDGGLSCFVAVQYGEDTTYAGGQVSVTIPVGATMPITLPIQGLAAGTVYHARALASNAVGGPVFGDDVEFTTPGAGNAPTGDTALPDGIDANFATLHATVDPNTETTSVSFFIRDTSPTGSEDEVEVPATATSSSATPVDFSATATNLQPFKKYAYRAEATNASGSVVGKDVPFRTKGSVTGDTVVVTTTTPATNILDTSALIHGTLTMDAVDTSYYFEFWITGQNKKFTQARFFDHTDSHPEGDLATYSVTEQITGLTASTAYNFRLCAVNSASSAVVYGTTRTLTTAAAPGVPPATGLVTQVLVISGTKLRGVALVNTNGEDTDCTFEASITQNFGVIAGVSPTVTEPDGGAGLVSSTITGLTPDTAYYVRLKMVHNVGPVTSYSTNIFGPISTNTLTLPTVTTEAITGVAATSMIANSTVIAPADDAGEGDTFAWFEWDTVSHPSGTGYPFSNASTPQQLAAGATHTPQLQLGGPGAPPPLTPGTDYYVRAFARNNAGTVSGSEETETTTGGGPTLDPVPTAGTTSNLTPRSFNMYGTLQTNGSDTTITFQYTTQNDLNFASAVSLTAQVIADDPRTIDIGDFTDYLPTHAATWRWRIKAVNGTGVEVFAYPSFPGTVQCPDNAPNSTNPTPATATLKGVHVPNAVILSMHDMVSARLRAFVKHNGQRMWFRYEYGTDPTLATYTITPEGTYSFRGPGLVGLPGGLLQGEMRTAGYLTGLTQNTTYYYRLRCWSVEGLHTSAIGNFTTAATGVFSANWAASVGTQKPARCMTGPVPKNLRTGVGTLDKDNEVVWDDLGGGAGLSYSAAEDAYSIIVTPADVTVKFNAALNLTRLDSQNQGVSNIVYALRQARVGDKIWVDGSYLGLVARYNGGPVFTLGAVVSGATTFGTANEWRAVVHRAVGGTNAHVILRLTTAANTLPTSAYATALNAGTSTASTLPTFENIQEVVNNALVGSPITNVRLYWSGGYPYEFGNLGGDSGTYHASPAADIAYWSVGGFRYPITGVRIMAKTTGTPFIMTNFRGSNADGGFNGVFLKDFKCSQMMNHIPESSIVQGQSSDTSATGGAGVLGMSDFRYFQCDPTNEGGYGTRQQFRGQSPISPHFWRGTYSPSNQHSNYIDSPGEVNPNGWVYNTLSVSGFTADGLKTTSGYSFTQLPARGDRGQNSQTGPGYMPGRGPGAIINCTGMGGTSAGSISVYGYFGTLTIDGFTHYGEPTGQTRQAMVLQDDQGKGMWLNARGFPNSTLIIDNFTSRVTNIEDVSIKLRGWQHVTINDLTWFSPNNKPLIELFETPGVFENGFVQFTGAGSATGALKAWGGVNGQVGWPPLSAVPLANRIHYGGNSITSDQDYQDLQDGKNYSTVQ